MRKLLTIIALILTVAMCASFAAAADTISGLSSVSKDVSLTYSAVSEDKTTVVYSADVTWTDVTFAYNAGTTQWNPETHDYTASGASAKWSDNKGSVKVTNHSNAAVNVAVAFTSASNGSAKVSVSSGNFSLATAAGTTVSNAPSKTVTLTASGTPANSGKLGTIKVTISK